MSFLRRRKTSSTNSADPAGEALTAPLLATERSDLADDDDADALALSPTPSSPSSLAALLWQALVAAPVATAISILAPFLPPRWRPLSLSRNARRALDALREDASTPFDPLSLEHERDLQGLWAASFGISVPYPQESGGKSPLWKEVGWQGEDPRTDLRGGGRGALTAALHMNKETPLLWARLRGKRRRDNSGGGGSSSNPWWVAPEGLEYPFGAAGVNVAFMVGQVAGLHSHDAGSGAAAAAAAAVPSSSSSSAPAAAAAAGSVSRGGKGRGPAPSRGPPRTAAAKGFAALLAASVPDEEQAPSSSSSSALAESDGGSGGGGGCDDDPHSVALRSKAWSVFGDVYCAAFEALDDEWCLHKASYMDFPAVMVATRARLERALASRRAADSKEGLRRELRRRGN